MALAVLIFSEGFDKTSLDKTKFAREYFLPEQFVPRKIRNFNKLSPLLPHRLLKLVSFWYVHTRCSEPIPQTKGW